MPRDPYEVLGVGKKASAEEIKQAYRKLARQLHPDRNPGEKQAETKFKEVQAAYEILGDKEKKGQYDQFGFAGPWQGSGAGGGGNPFSGNFGNINMEDLSRAFGQMGGGGGVDFDSMFQRGKRHSRRQPAPEDLQIEVEIPLEMAAAGGKLSVEIQGKALQVSIPAGLREGGKIRLQGQGRNGGDLYLVSRILPHPYFSREENNLVLEVPITISEALLGTKVDVPSLGGGRLGVKIPAGVSSGTRLRLRGKGIEGGDLLVQIKISVPASPGEAGIKLAEEFSRAFPQDPRSGLPWKFS
ncbi:MAG: J domain-containing protein [Gemmataceae bacterium]|nr:J domain-containing protein [Gemmataceae bacterium]